MIDRDELLHRLDDYTSGIMPDEAAAPFEDELFAAAASGKADEADFAHRLTHDIAWYVPMGELFAPMKKEQIDALRKEPHVHYIDIEENTVVEQWPEDTQLVVYRVAVDLRGCDHVEVEVRSPGGETLKTFRDVGFDAADGAIYSTCHEPVAYGTFLAAPCVVHVEGTKDGRSAVTTELRITQR